MGSRLRWLTELVTHDADAIYRLYGVDIRPKWFPVLYTLFNGSDNSVTGIAKSIGQTHPSVSNIIREMKAAGLILDTKDDSDRRTTVISLTPKGKALQPRLEEICDDVRTAARTIDEAAPHSLWKAIDNWERQLSEKSLFARIAAEKAGREQRSVEIVDYQPDHLLTFKRLNIMWINTHWSLEPHDLEVLGDPEGSILSKGGFILVALVDGRPLGVIAMCRTDNGDYDFELAKLAVDPEARGQGLGEKLCRTALDRAARLGAKRIFLESNTLLRPAISLYRKLGFTELTEYSPAYRRGDIQMELTIQ